MGMPLNQQRWTGPAQIISDMLLAGIGLTVLILPAFSLSNELLGEPLTRSTMTTIVVLLALFGAPFYSAGYLSLARLRDMCLLFVSTGLVLSTASAIIIITLQISINSSAPRIIVWGISYGITFGIGLWTFRLWSR